MKRAAFSHILQNSLRLYLIDDRYQVRRSILDDIVRAEYYEAFYEFRRFRGGESLKEKHEDLFHVWLQNVPATIVTIASGDM